MPHGNGTELAAALRERRPGLKVIYMSGYADHHLAGSRILEEGAPFLQKPFAAASLSSKVRETLSGGPDEVLRREGSGTERSEQ
jgi:DNA-binding NtrC family response regulator